MKNWKRDNFCATVGGILFILGLILVMYLETNW